MTYKLQSTTVPDSCIQKNAEMFGLSWDMAILQIGQSKIKRGSSISTTTTE